ncbi:MAG TPA: hypothetical protein VFX25_19490, partial [Streptosporangiaceae bacterium]|nr:hypothetical protein [Streptosporangiaceae bacterium]
PQELPENRSRSRSPPDDPHPAAASSRVSRRLDMFIGQYTVDWQHLFGASAVATIPVLILFAIIERRIVSGLTAGSVK